MKLLVAVWEQVYGLFVDDGQIAVGTLAALVLTGLWTALTGKQEGLHSLGGLVLFALLMALLLANLRSAGKSALARAASIGETSPQPDRQRDPRT